ncbi:hypothetical protein PHLCEN_2v13268 [Hermanssonia centrifuga]|uniref:DUF6532 domain-containing protein n=1 Tax=Hermanssonia centrifuga TaxID=98765 RepID=A0A2R6NEL0_9APHY|nr:hypothetical protein PHLCEN_2v13268 [Hermanssonia centrifuga]
MQAFQEALAHKNALREKRSQQVAAFQVSDENFGLPSSQAPPSSQIRMLRAAQQAQVLEEDQWEMQQDPNADSPVDDINEDEDLESIDNITMTGAEWAALSPRNPNLVRRFSHLKTTTPTPVAASIPDAPCRPLVRRLNKKASTVTPTSSQESVLTASATPTPVTNKPTNGMLAPNIASAGTKRSAEDLSETEDDSARPTSAKKARPKVSDVADTLRRAVLQAAIVKYRCGISTLAAFPDNPTHADDMAASSWFTACKDSHFLRTSDPLPITEDDVKVIKSRAPQIRGEVKIAARGSVKTGYGFFTHDGKDETIKKNRELHALLVTDGAFTWTNPHNVGARGTAYRHPVILDVIIKSWFSNRKDEGITEDSYFNAPGIPLVTIALVLAAIQNSLDEWREGVFKSMDFTDKDYAKKYREHLKTLRGWEKLCKERGSKSVEMLQMDLLKAARYVSILCKTISQLNRSYSASAGLSDEDNLLSDTIPSLTDLIASEEFSDSPV